MRKMSRISPRVLAYTRKAIHHPESVRHFTAWTEKGIRPPIFLEDREANIDLADLLVAHAVSSRTPHPLLEGLWIEGMDDYPLGRVMIDCLTWDKETFLRKRAVFERAYKLHARLRGK